MRASCSDCGETYYTYTSVYNSSYIYYSHINSFSVLSDKMNDEALEHYGMFTIAAYYTGSGTFEYVPNVALEKNNYTQFKQYDGSYKVGNAVISFEAKTTDCACTSKIVWSIKVGNEVLRSGVFTKHNENDYTTVSYTSRLDACHTRVTYGHKCNVCGKTFYDYSYLFESHQFEKDATPVEIQEKTDIMPGYKIYHETCKVCGEDHYVCEFDWPCSHEHLAFADGKWTCPDCGYSVAGTADEKPLALFEELHHEYISDDQLAYAVKLFGEDYPYSNDLFWNYEFMMVVYAEVNSEPQILARSYMQSDYLYFDVHYENHGFESFKVWYLQISQGGYDNLLEQARAVYENSYGNPDGATFHYAIVILSNSGQATSFMFILN